MDFWGVVMPGMRFERKHNSAFQFVVAIVNYQGTYSDRRQSFPVPYLSWYKSF